MAKEQDLPLNPLKISGLCGRLMCCLRYEFDAYKDYKSRAPKRGTIIETPLGLAKVSELNTPREMVGMKFEDGRRVSVPLAGMGCSKGTGCPCTVSREVLEEAGGTGTALAFAALDREAEMAAAPPAPVAKPSRPSGGGRSAGGRTASGSKPAGGSKPASGTKAPAPAPKEASDGESTAAPRGEGRKRRRRGGRGGESAGGDTPKQDKATDKPRADKPRAAKPQGGDKPAGAEAPASTGEGRKTPRRRRRRGSGSGGSGGDAPQA